MKLRQTLPALLASGFVLGLAGCGFTPLYATNGAGGSLSAIDVQMPITAAFNGDTQDRTGFLLKQSLIDELAVKPDAAARYRLSSRIVEHRLPRGVRVNNVANRYEVNMTVAYALTEVATNKVVVQGTAPVIVVYDSADPPYAGTVAAQNGDERAAQQAAIQIRLALGRYFAGRPLGAPGLVETPIPQNTTDTP